MRTIKKLFGIILSVLALACGYLYIRHPFVFQDLSGYPGQLGMALSMSRFKVDHGLTDIEQFDAFIANELADNNVKGAAVAIIANGDIVWSQGYGHANAESGLLATADTPFMIGSISKAVTGVTLMHAVEQGLIDLDADINTYLPFELHNPNVTDGDPITLRHLATHTSGIIDNDWVYANSYQIGDSDMSLEQFLRSYLIEGGNHYNPSKNFLDSQPGDVSEYSNIATGLAAYVFAQATGTDLDVYGTDHIFKPLGMRNTGWFLTDFADTAQIAQPYGWLNRPIPHYGYPTWPEGQLRTSANDLAKLLAMVMGDGAYAGTQLLAPETVEAMTAKQTFAGLADVTGEGIFWSYIKGGYVGHNGGDAGVSTGMYYDPERNIGLVMLTNNSVGRGFEPVLKATYQLLRGEGSAELIQSIK